jgi:8-oxo-dGTP diphosphatase
MSEDRVEYVVNAEAAIYRDGEYLLARRAEQEDHAAGTWSLVGGKVEGVAEAENVLERTVRREVREEVGVELGATEYVESAAFVGDGGAHVVNVVFLCEHDEGTPEVREPEELAAVEWVDPDAIRSHEDVPGFTARYVAAAERERRRLGW